LNNSQVLHRSITKHELLLLRNQVSTNIHPDYKWDLLPNSKVDLFKRNRSRVFRDVIRLLRDMTQINKF